MSKVSEALKTIYQEELSERIAFRNVEEFNQCDELVQIIINDRIEELNKILKGVEKMIRIISDITEGNARIEYDKNNVIAINERGAITVICEGKLIKTITFYDLVCAVSCLE